MAREIALTRGRVALVDDEDFERVAAVRWNARLSYSGGRNWYASRSVDGGAVLMHRFILNAPPGLEVDHVNHDGLDNRRSNLRLCTRSQNAVNTPLQAGRSGLFGVYACPKTNRFRAYARHHGRSVSAGSYGCPLEAAIARDALVRRLHGEFARLNFPCVRAA